MNDSLPLAAAEIIPHRAEMLLVDELTAYDARSGIGLVRARCRPESIFVRCDGETTGQGQKLEEVVLLEMIAQAYACLKGYSDRLAGRPAGWGFLVGIRRWRCHGRPRVGEQLKVAVRTAAQVETFYIASGEVKVGDRLLAQGELKLWIPSQGDQEDR